MDRITDQITRLGTHAHNFYVVAEGGKATVVDAGCVRELPKLEKALAEIELGLDDVEAVLVTHAHADHFGFAAEAIEKGVTVKVHEDEATRAAGTYEGRFAVSPSELPMYKPAVLRNFLPMVVAGVMDVRHTDDFETVTDGEALDLPGRPTVVHTPGHTEGHAAFHSPSLDAVFTGDALATMPLLGGPHGPQLIEDPFHLDPAQARESLARLATLDAGLVLPGHGQPMRVPIAEAVAAC
jgi:glyoxylase-like metal-dependent hydrolase (beta-lactamase superfamily II)